MNSVSEIYTFTDPSVHFSLPRIERGDDAPKGVINFDADGTIIISPINVQ